TMDENGLEPIGPLRIVTTEFARDTYTFDVVQAVRPKGTGEDAATDADATAATDAAEGGDAEGVDEAAEPAFVVTESEPLDAEGMKLLGPVTFVRSEPTRVARAAYTGHMAEPDAARNATLAWAPTQGPEATGRPHQPH